MPTDIRQTKETNDIREKQMEKALGLLDEARKQFAEAIRQRNDARRDVECMRNDLRTIGEEYDALQKERDELRYLLSVLTGAEGPRRLEHTGSFSCEPGRNIYRDGKPFVYIGKCEGTCPSDADDAARTIAALLNKDEEQRWAKETAK